MSVAVDTRRVDGVDTIVLRSERLEVEVAPSVGGRITRLVDRAAGKDLLWRNAGLPLRREQPFAAYDPAFYGGIDELLPNDGPETVQGVQWPDHGELWTMPLEAQVIGDRLRLAGCLPRCGLHYERTMRLLDGASSLENRYRITNETDTPVRFIWRMHAALAISPGSRIECPARTARALDPAYTRQPSLDPFPWPEGTHVIPAADGTGEFMVLEGLREGSAALVNLDAATCFTCTFDPAVFPCVVVFTSYGGFYGHYTAVLEPCTCPSLTVAEAEKTAQSLCLEPGESLETTIRMSAHSA